MKTEQGYLNAQYNYRTDVRKKVTTLIKEILEEDLPDKTNCAALHRALQEYYPNAQMIATPDFHIMTLIDDTIYDYTGEVGRFVGPGDKTFSKSFRWPQVNKTVYR